MASPTRETIKTDRQQRELLTIYFYWTGRALMSSARARIVCGRKVYFIIVRRVFASRERKKTPTEMTMNVAVRHEIILPKLEPSLCENRKTYPLKTTYVKYYIEESQISTYNQD